MECPKCKCQADFQIVVEDNKKYIKCNKCNALISANDLRDYMQQPHHENPPEKKWTAAGVVTLIITFGLVITFLGFFFSNNKSQDNVDTQSKPAAAKQTKTSEETDAYGWSKNDYIEFRSMTITILDKFVAHYSLPFNFNEWRFAKFDDEGRIIATTSCTFKNMIEKQHLIFVFTRGEDKDGDGEADDFYPHFLSIGDTIYVNDGSCNEFFQNLQDAMQNFE